VGVNLTWSKLSQQIIREVRG